MNVQLKDITVTARDGRVSHLEQVYIRGSHVRFFIVPDMLRYGYPSHYDKPALNKWSREKMGTNVVCTGTRPCSGAATSAEEESVWPAAGRRSAEQGLVVGVLPAGGRHVWGGRGIVVDMLISWSGGLV